MAHLVQQPILSPARLIALGLVDVSRREELVGNASGLAQPHRAIGAARLFELLAVLSQLRAEGRSQNGIPVGSNPAFGFIDRGFQVPDQLTP